jgi:hypothetical protein
MLALGSLAVVAVVLLAGQKIGGRDGKMAPPKDFKELVEQYQRLDAEAVAQKERTAALAKELAWLSNNTFRPGLILPYHGPMADAEALSAEGWVVCDGRPIKDGKAAPRFKNAAAPDLTSRFLKGSNNSGQPSGSPKVTTSSDGNHAHLPPAKWYPRGFREEGRFASVDTGGGDFKKEKVTTQDAGTHAHTVSLDPPAYSVIYLMYVREVAPRK